MTISVEDLQVKNGKIPSIMNGRLFRGGVQEADDGTFEAVVNDGPRKTTILKGYATREEAGEAFDAARGRKSQS